MAADGSLCVRVGEAKYPGKVFYNRYRGLTANLAAQIIGLQICLGGWVGLAIRQFMDSASSGVNFVCATAVFLPLAYLLQRAVFAVFLASECVPVCTAGSDDWSWRKTGLSLRIIAELTAYEIIVLAGGCGAWLAYVFAGGVGAVCVLLMWAALSPYAFSLVSRLTQTRENLSRARRYPDGETPADYYDRIDGGQI